MTRCPRRPRGPRVRLLDEVVTEQRARGSAAGQVNADLFAAPVVRFGHEQRDEHEPGGGAHGERGPQLHRVLLNERIERFHDDERQEPGERCHLRLDAPGTVLGRHQLGGNKPRDGPQAQTEPGDERAQDEQHRDLPRRAVQRSCGRKNRANHRRCRIILRVDSERSERVFDRIDQQINT